MSEGGFLIRPVRLELLDETFFDVCAYNIDHESPPWKGPGIL